MNELPVIGWCQVCDQRPVRLFPHSEDPSNMLCRDCVQEPLITEDDLEADVEYDKMLCRWLGVDESELADLWIHMRDFARAQN